MGVERLLHASGSPKRSGGRRDQREEQTEAIIRRGKMKKKVRNSNWPVVPMLAREIRKKLAKAKVRPNALLEGLEAQRRRLFRERYQREPRKA